MKTKYLYHVTTREHAKEILKKGLIPKIGPNSKLVKESEPTVYLCERKDVPYWRMMLSRPTVLAVDMNIIRQLDITDNVIHHEYKRYSEYRITAHIKPEFIKRTHISHDRDEQINRELCLSYLIDISDICKRCAEYYTYQYDYDDDYDYDICSPYDNLKIQMNAMLTVLKTINYQAVCSEDIRNALQDFGESGEYTFCDTYNHTDKKLYQKLIEYPNDDLRPLRHELYDYIKNNLSCCLDMNTGGWCHY